MQQSLISSMTFTHPVTSVVVVIVVGCKIKHDRKLYHKSPFDLELILVLFLRPNNYFELKFLSESYLFNWIICTIAVVVHVPTWYYSYPPHFSFLLLFFIIVPLSCFYLFESSGLFLHDDENEWWQDTKCSFYKSFFNNFFGSFLR